MTTEDDVVGRLQEIIDYIEDNYLTSDELEAIAELIEIVALELEV